MMTAENASGSLTSSIEILSRTPELKLFQEHISNLCLKLEKLQSLRHRQYRSMDRNL
ncbi:hypothetical protein [Shewanella canadensis]|uniref:hypothetical protein n=1 Tax=Shewanella canadensis TaxID=271096 RepID=UPI001639A843|nr:hypothetical protein [Shewanella canadensis]